MVSAKSSSAHSDMVTILTIIHIHHYVTRSAEIYRLGVQYCINQTRIDLNVRGLGLLCAAIGETIKIRNKIHLFQGFRSSFLLFPLQVKAAVVGLIVVGTHIHTTAVVLYSRT